MKIYTAVEGQAAVQDQNLRLWMTPTIGAHRGATWSGGRALIANYNVANAQATATSTQASGTYAVNAAPLPNADHFISVSGLTACIGVLVVRSSGGGFVHGVTAHFNGNYDNQGAWTSIAQGVANVAGTLYAIVIASTDTSSFWLDSVIVPTFRGHLRNMGVSDAHILFYRSSRGATAFFLRRDGVMGEPIDSNHISP